MMIADMPLDGELPDPFAAVVEERRYGRFRLNDMMVRNEPRMALAALAGCLVVRAESSHYWMAVEYVALHPEFDHRPLFAEPPLYDCVFTKHDDGSVTRRFVRGVG